MSGGRIDHSFSGGIYWTVAWLGMKWNTKKGFEDWTRFCFKKRREEKKRKKKKKRKKIRERGRKRGEKEEKTGKKKKSPHTVSFWWVGAPVIPANFSCHERTCLCGSADTWIKSIDVYTRTSPVHSTTVPRDSIVPRHAKRPAPDTAYQIR